MDAALSTIGRRDPATAVRAREARAYPGYAAGADYNSGAKLVRSAESPSHRRAGRVVMRYPAQLVRFVLVFPFVMAVVLLWVAVGFLLWIPTFVVALLEYQLAILWHLASRQRVTSKVRDLEASLFYYFRGFGIILSALLPSREAPDAGAPGFGAALRDSFRPFLVKVLQAIVVWSAILAFLWYKGYLNVIADALGQ